MKRRMVVVAIACWVAWLATASWTSSLSVLSLTPPAGEPFELALIKSAIVLISWFAAVMVAPVLMLTAVAWKLVSPHPDPLPARGEGAPQRFDV